LSYDEEVAPAFRTLLVNPPRWISSSGAECCEG
jgi:hypothetical protein